MHRYDIDDLGGRDPQLIARLTTALEPVLERLFHPKVTGLEHVPQGAALYVGNHSGGTLTPDSFVLCAALLRQLGLSAVPYGLAHGVAIQMPPFHQLLVPLGAVRASHENAHKIFAAGLKALVYPGGDIDAFRPHRHRDRVVFGTRRGYVRLALREGVPIVPVVSFGGHSTFLVLDDGRWLAHLLRVDKLFRIKVWPIILALPFGLWVGPTPPHWPVPSKIRIEILDPIHFDRTGEEAARDVAYVEACHERVIGVMQHKLSEMAAAAR